MMQDTRDDGGKARDPGADLSTADLAGASPDRPRTLDAKRLLEKDSPLPLEGPAGTASTNDSGRSDSRGAKTARALEQETGPLVSGNEANELRGQRETVQ